MGKPTLPLKLFCIFFSLTMVIYGQTQLVWNQINDLNFPRNLYSQIMLLDDGRILAVGGISEISDSNKTAEILDSLNGSWHYVQPTQIKRQQGHQLVKLDDGKIIVIGGMVKINETTFESTKSCEIFNPSLNTWTNAASLNIDRQYGFTATKLSDGRILVIGGIQIIDSLRRGISQCEIFDPLLNTWTITDSLKFPRQDHSAVLLNNGKVLVAGGLDGIRNLTKSCEIFDPVTGKWSFVDSTNDTKMYFSMKQLSNGSVIAIGCSSSFEVYDIVNNKWTIKTNLIDYPAMPYLFEKNNKVIVLGRDNLFSLDLSNFTQQFPTLINTQEYDSHYIYLDSNKMLKIGGDTFIGDMIAPSKRCYICENINIVNVDNQSTNKLPNTFELAQNHPNPFNPSTTISFSLPKTEFVTLKIYDVLGKEVVTLTNEELSAGKHTKQWNADGFSSGIYVYKLQAGIYSTVKKMLLLK